MNLLKHIRAALVDGDEFYVGWVKEKEFSTHELDGYGCFGPMTKRDGHIERVIAPGKAFKKLIRDGLSNPDSFTKMPIETVEKLFA